MAHFICFVSNCHASIITVNDMFLTSSSCFHKSFGHFVGQLNCYNVAVFFQRSLLFGHKVTEVPVSYCCVVQPPPMSVQSFMTVFSWERVCKVRPWITCVLFRTTMEHLKLKAISSVMLQIIYSRVKLFKIESRSYGDDVTQTST